MVLPALRYRQVGTGLTSTKSATTEATAAPTAEVDVSKAKAHNAKNHCGFIAACYFRTTSKRRKLWSRS